MEPLFIDLRFAVRQAWRRPGFTVLFVLLFALGVGATGAMFAVVRNVLYTDLPFREPDRIVVGFAPQPEIPDGSLSGPDFVDWKEGASSFEALAAVIDMSGNLVVGDEAIRIPGAAVTAEYFEVLGEDAVLGRLFTAEEERSSRRVAVISDRLHREHFGADQAAIGRTMTLEGELYEVVGVMRPGFHFVYRWSEADIWVPLGLTAPDADPIYTERGSHNFRVLGRLAPGATPESATAELAGIAARLEEAYPITNTRVGARVMDLKEYLVGRSRSPLHLLFGAIAFVLLLTCVNGANLLLARGSGRAAEIAMRAALGASRARIVRQLLTESVVLALAGGIVGLLIALWALDLFTWVLADMIPPTAKVSLDPTTLAFTLAVAVATGALAGIAPALSISRLEAFGTLKEGAARATSSSARSRLRSALVVAEVAIAIALLSGAGLLLKSYAAVQAVDDGLDPEHLHTALVSLPAARFAEHDNRARYQEALLERLRETPGVTSAASIDTLPLTGWGTSGDIIVEGQPRLPRGEAPIVERRRATADYFSTMGIPIVAGRAFTAADTLDSEPVMIVNESFAKRFFPGEDALGKHARWNTDNLPPARIVGVFADVRTFGPEQPVPLESFIPFAQHSNRYMSFVVKTAPGIDGAEALISAARAVDPLQPLFRVLSMDEIRSKKVIGRRSTVVLLGVFAAVAMLLAALGIYGVVSHQTAQRTREVGIRLALGARPFDVVALVVRQSMVVVGIGVGIGLAVALGGSRLVDAFLFGTSPLDPSVHVLVALGVALVGFLSSAIPARRAAAVAPASALRYE